MVDVHHTLREIAAIPHEALPYGSPAREALNTLARAECDVSVYQHGNGEWIVWLRPAWAWQEGRHPLAEWMRDYAALTAEALARQAESARKAEVA